MTDWADETEAALLQAAMPLADTLGWSVALVKAAGARIGLSGADVDLLLPNGPRDLAALLSRHHDAGARAALANQDPAALKIRERIRAGAEARLEAAAADMSATRRWMGFLALPPNAALGLRLAWESADVVWRWAGDQATDENHYSKRAILAGVLISLLPVRLNQGREIALAQLDARIENVMTFERWKAGLPTSTFGADLAAALGRLRFAGR